MRHQAAGRGAAGKRAAIALPASGFAESSRTGGKVWTSRVDIRNQPAEISNTTRSPSCPASQPPTSGETIVPAT